jgi:uncharacterized membrane protein YcaP (DUF421 family)
VEGRPIILALDGTIAEKSRLASKISMCDLEEALREKGLDGLEEIGKARKLVLEPSGKISVIKKDA